MDIDGVKDIRINVEVEPGVTGYMVEKALKEALGYSPEGVRISDRIFPEKRGAKPRGLST